MLSEIYNADSSFTYQVGGYTGDAWTYKYTRTLEAIFGDGTEFDNSILLSGNLDCDLFKSVNNQRYEYMMVVKDSESSSPNYRKMIKDPAFEGYEQAKLLGSCLLQTGNWSSFSVYNLTQMKPVIGAEMKGARFCLGNTLNGFKKLTLFPVNMSVEKQPPEMAGSTTTYSAINYTTTTTLEDIYNKTLQSSGFDMKHTERGLTNTTNYTFDSNYRPILTFVILFNDEILLVNASYLITKGDGGVIGNYQNGMPVSHAFGKVMESPEFIQMCTDVTKPQWVCRPQVGVENNLGLYCEVYTSRSTWYLRQHMLYNGIIVRRLLTISGLFFLWDSTYAGTGALTTAFNENLCLGSRDEYGQIEQDGYNKGWSDIVENDEYYDKLDYKDMPTVNPNPPSPEDVDDDIENMRDARMDYFGGNIGYYYVTPSEMYQLNHWLATQEEYADLDVQKSVISLKSYPVQLTSRMIINKRSQTTEGQPITIKFDRAVSTVNSSIIDSTNGVLNLGEYTIEPKYNNFLDYAPYTTIQVYIPLFGWIPLDDKCMGTTIHCIVYVDIRTGSARCVIYSNGRDVAERIGMYGVDISMTNENNGVKVGAMIRNSMSSVSSLNTMLTSRTSGSVIGYANSITNGAIATKQNYANAYGSGVGDTTAWNGAGHCYIKIERPIADNSKDYAKRYGLPLLKTETLSNLKGFTKCENANINGNMTLEEKTMIENYLNSGVIL